MANKTKEQKYLDSNPDATPYDMLMAGVINQERFDELEGANNGNATQAVDEFLQNKSARPSKVIVHETDPKPIQPRLSTHAAGTARVFLLDKKMGKTTAMARGAAERMVRKYPQRYEIK